MPAASPSASRLRFLGAALWLGALACGGDRDPAPTLLAEPADLVVFEGQAALFQVKAQGGNGVRYQWKRNGAGIPGAVDSHLFLAATAPGDDGARISVAVSNGDSGPTESRTAVLTVHPPLDLRFKWVGAPFTPDAALGANVLGSATLSSGTEFANGATSPLVLGVTCPGGDLNCSWLYTVMAAPRMSASYQAAPLAALDALGAAWPSALPQGSVITSLDLHEADGVFALASDLSTQAGTFAPAQGTAAPADLQALATAEGEAGRVITAVSHRSGQVVWVSYGWSRAAGTAYEARVAFATAATAGDEAARMAADGYALTAFGDGDDGANGFVLVGARVKGDTTPVPARVITTPDVPWDLIPGWAMVGVYFLDGTQQRVTWILEQ
jgi:hypothetical protein